VEAPPWLKYRDSRTHSEKGDYLSNLFADTDAAKWLVPILRLRLDWAVPQIKNETLDQTWFSGPELGAIVDFLTIHGADDDLRRAYQIEEEFRASRSVMRLSLEMLHGGIG